jgi:hypothetical protein
MSFRRQASWEKIMSPGGKLTAVACHPTRKVNRAEELTYLSTNIYIELVHNACIYTILPSATGSS